MSGNDDGYEAGKEKGAEGKTRSNSDDEADNEILTINLDLMEYLISAINKFIEPINISMPLNLSDNDDEEGVDNFLYESIQKKNEKRESLGEIIYYIGVMTQNCLNIIDPNSIPTEFLEKLNALNDTIEKADSELRRTPEVVFKTRHDRSVKLHIESVLEEFKKVYTSLCSTRNIQTSSTHSPDPKKTKRQ